MRATTMVAGKCTRPPPPPPPATPEAPATARSAPRETRTVRGDGERSQRRVEEDVPLREAPRLPTLPYLLCPRDQTPVAPSHHLSSHPLATTTTHHLTGPPPSLLPLPLPWRPTTWAPPPRCPPPPSPTSLTMAFLWAAAVASSASPLPLLTRTGALWLQRRRGMRSSGRAGGGTEWRPLVAAMGGMAGGTGSRRSEIWCAPAAAETGTAAVAVVAAVGASSLASPARWLLPLLSCKTQASSS